MGQLAKKRACTTNAYVYALREKAEHVQTVTFKDQAREIISLYRLQNLHTNLRWQNPLEFEHLVQSVHAGKKYLCCRANSELFDCDLQQWDGCSASYFRQVSNWPSDDTRGILVGMGRLAASMLCISAFALVSLICRTVGSCSMLCIMVSGHVLCRRIAWHPSTFWSVSLMYSVVVYRRLCLGMCFPARHWQSSLVYHICARPFRACMLCIKGLTLRACLCTHDIGLWSCSFILRPPLPYSD